MVSTSTFSPPRVPIDPRIRRRRIEVRRHQGRRRLRLLVVALTVVLVTASGWLILRSPLVDVDTIVIRGAVRSDADALRRASGVVRGAPMIDVDEAGAARAVEALPWVKEAQVSRQWAGTVSITITERTAVAALSRGENLGWALLDQTGRVLEQVSEVPSGLVTLDGTGPPGPPGTVVAGSDQTLALATALSEPLAAKVASVRVVSGPELELELDSSGTVRLGPPTGLDRKLAAVETMLASVDLRGLAVLDVRVPSSPVLTRR
jgi:cell division protein FtsQ